MDVQQLSVKLALRDTGAFDLESLIPVFHRWIRERVLTHRLLIDVADYRHVPAGPGVFIVGHECHVGVDEEGGLGLLYSRKRDEPGAAPDKLREALRDTLQAAVLLEREELPVSVQTSMIEVRVVSRLYAENTQETFDGFRGAIAPILNDLWGAHEISHLAEDGEPFGVRITAQNAPSASAMLGQLGGPSSGA